MSLAVDYSLNIFTFYKQTERVRSSPHPH